MKRVSGFTLIELMIAVAILAVVAALALPAYNNYIQTSRVGVLVQNISTIEMFQEDFRLRNGAYSAGVFNAGPDADLLALGWVPGNDDGTTYTIALVGGSYTVTAVDTAGTTVCRRYPERVDC
jgi:type IV pilus assembly protein PilE